MKIVFGAMSLPLSRQLDEQGLTAEPKAVATLQRLADAVVLLAIHSIVTDAEKARMRKRLINAIAAKASPKPAEPAA